MVSFIHIFGTSQVLVHLRLASFQLNPSTSRFVTHCLRPQLSRSMVKNRSSVILLRLAKELR